VDWKKYQEPIEKEHKTKGFEGRYGAGLPRVSDGSFLFIQHMISKMKPVGDNPDTKGIIEGGSRIALILSGSPLFSGQAGSGESEIRRWIIENDWLEGIVAMPDQMFYNTGIGTYIWIISNRKDEKSKGLVRLVDARNLGTKMRKSLGDKRKELTNDAIAEITELYSEAITKTTDNRIKVMRNEEFGFARLTVERPLRPIWKVDAEVLELAPVVLRDRLQKMLGNTYASEKDAEDAIKKNGFEGKEVKAALKEISSTDPSARPVSGKKQVFEPDAELRDNENVPLPIGYLELDEAARIAAIEKTAEDYLNKEILKYVPDAWIDHSKTKIGYEIPFTRQFYTYIPPRPANQLKSEIEKLESELQRLLKEI